MNLAAKRFLLSRLPLLWGLSFIGLAIAAPSSFALELSPGIDTGTAWTFGTLKTDSGSVGSRGVQMLSIHAFPNLKFASTVRDVPLEIRPGVLGEYRFIGQLTDPAALDGSNYRGTGFLLGVGGRLEIRRFSLMLTYDVFGTQSVAKPITSVSTGEVSYKSASGVRAIFGYSYLPTFSIDLFLQRTSFNAYSKDQQSYSISADPLKQTMIGIGTRVLY